MHDYIEKFSLNGEILDVNLVSTKERLVMVVETMMKEKGFVPVLDIDPQFTLDYVPEGEKYNFKLTVYGVEAEEEDAAWEIAGLMNGKKIMRYTPRPK